MKYPANWDKWDDETRKETQKCPMGYAYGCRWLVEILPEEITKEILELFTEGQQ